ncbi:hypothetical protein BDV41DRAFT_536325 [Aspergillus transmontanensis]|uniref:Uncharacterized protein n=1 Tax=Aspergillus transmontanensis TaxID=1034304 RepID=A0A5N6W0Y2_9EURO|nr:hypothetical protein BDV41DRAFT_536325 [Aspergillus transmontanensis]
MLENGPRVSAMSERGGLLGRLDPQMWAGMERRAHRCARTDDHAGGRHLPLFRWSCWTTIIYWLTSDACALRNIVLTWGVHPRLRSIIRRLPSCIIHRSCRRSRGAILWR